MWHSLKHNNKPCILSNIFRYYQFIIWSYFLIGLFKKTIKFDYRYFLKKQPLLLLKRSFHTIRSNQFNCWNQNVSNVIYCENLIQFMLWIFSEHETPIYLVENFCCVISGIILDSHTSWCSSGINHTSCVYTVHQNCHTDKC